MTRDEDDPATEEEEEEDCAPESLVLPTRDLMSHSATESLGGIGGGGGEGGVRGGAGGGHSGHCHAWLETQSGASGRHCAYVFPGRWKQPKGRFPGMPGSQQLSLSGWPCLWYLKQFPQFSVQMTGAGDLGGSPGPGGGSGSGEGGGGGEGGEGGGDGVQPQVPSGTHCPSSSSGLQSANIAPMRGRHTKGRPRSSGLQQCSGSASAVKCTPSTEPSSAAQHDSNGFAVQRDGAAGGGGGGGAGGGLGQGTCGGGMKKLGHSQSALLWHRPFSS